MTPQTLFVERSVQRRRNGQLRIARIRLEVILHLRDDDLYDLVDHFVDAIRIFVRRYDVAREYVAGRRTIRFVNVVHDIDDPLLQYDDALRERDA